MYIPIDVINHHIIPFIDEYQEHRDKLHHSLHILFGCHNIAVALALFTYPANTGPEPYLFRLYDENNRYIKNKIELQKYMKNKS